MAEIAINEILKRLPVGEGQKEAGAPTLICRALHGEPPPKDCDEGKQWMRALRNIERHLDKQSCYIKGISTDKVGGRRYYWWDSSSVKDDWLARDSSFIKATNRQVAFCLLNRHLKTLLPPEVNEELQPVFKMAETQLTEKATPEAAKYRHLLDKVDVYFQPLPMEAEQIDSVLRDNIFTAVLGEKVIQADYHSNHDPNWTGRLTLSLQKLIFKYNHLKVVAYNHETQQTREITASRLSNIWFAEDDYVESHLEYSVQNIILRTNSAYFYDGYFKSVSISEDQEIFFDEDSGSWVIRFSLKLPYKEGSREADYFDLVNQLSGWADQIEVVEPPALREAMLQRINNIRIRYGLG